MTEPTEDRPRNGRHDESAESIEDLLARFLARHGVDDEAFERWCRAHADERSRLHELYVDARAAARSFAGWTPPDGPDEPAASDGGPTLSGLRALVVDGDRRTESTGRTGGPLWRRLADDGAHRARYELRGSIAEGGMGHVLEVWDRNLRRTLAMKCVGSADEEPPAPDERLVTRFLEEAQITGQLQHPGIVPIHELGLDEDERAYFTMPHVGSCEFREVIDLARSERDGWTLVRALGVLIKVCEAVAFAHSKDVLHRDLKPSNVMVGRFGETYVMDWGLARVLDREDSHDLRLRSAQPAARTVTTERTASDTPSPLVTIDGDVVGTPAYMAPEQARGRVDGLGPRADVYSIGAMLYHLLAGHAPYAGRGGRKTPKAILTAVLAGEPPALLDVVPDVPVELAGICAKAMAREPEGRYASALDLARDLEAYLGARPVSVRESTPSYLLRLAFQRNRALCLTVGAAIVVALAWATFDLVQVRAAWEREQGLVAEAHEAWEAAQRLSDRSVAQLLRGRVDALHAGQHGALAKLTAWLADADDVLARLPSYRAAAARDPEDSSLAAIVGELGRLEAARATIAKRAERARRLPERTLDRPAERWREASEAIRTSSRYGGLELEPQLGLVPLRVDPDSGLWEFSVQLSGQRPFAGTDGRWILEPETAVILVLIPGGTWLPVAGGKGRDEPLAVEPFFLAKYEVTQGQWKRVMDADYASYAGLIVGQQVSDLHPVDCIDHPEALEFADRIGCTLPTEYQWELACRGGRDDTYYWWGNTFDGVERLENLADRSAEGTVQLRLGGWDNGWSVHAPVGSFEPNPYGLFDIAGNISEWCRNAWPAPGDRRSAFRGGSWYHPPEYAASGLWQADHPRSRNQARGLRVARPVVAQDEPRVASDR